MTDGHYYGSGATVDHDDASVLFPTDTVRAEVRQRRDAQVALDSVDGREVVVVSPTGFASSYFLSQHPLTAIKIESLSKGTLAKISAQSGVPLTEFEEIQIGRCREKPENMSLEEF